MGEESRQRIVRVPGSRRARLTPAPGTDPAPDVATDSTAKDAAASASRAAKGPNDDRLIQDIPPHY
ncbi:hypothetical protein LTA6_002385 [Microbacterium sp. LTA6]|uniref:hypothetical protein n=1 Tax=unclassified Microbacterium TaxID=2609290 RepID=UPI00324B2AE4